MLDDVVTDGKGYLKLSSILKALKKLENEHQEKSETRFWHQTQHAQKTDNTQVKGGFRFKKNVIVILALLILTISSGLILKSKPWENRPVQKTRKEAVETKHPTVLQKKVPEPNLIQKKPAFGKDSKTNVRTKTMVGTRPKPVRTSSLHVTESLRKTEIKPEKPLNISKKKVYEPVTTPKAATAEKRDKKPVQNTKTDRFVSIPVKRSGESQLEIQAIAWANAPESRLAVINSRVVREGEAIDGVFVLHIGKDEIIFKKGGEKWKQQF